MMPSESGLLPVIVKLGGSLLDLEDLAARLRGLFLSLKPAPIGIVVGGGAATDVVRDWDRRFRLGEKASHEIAIRSMRMTESLVAALVPESGVAESRESLREIWRAGRPAVLAIEPLLAQAEAAGISVPEPSWCVTSDSLAAWAAGYVEARRLLLLKSIPEPPGGLAAAIQAGHLDSAFPAFQRNLNVEWVNFRNISPALNPDA